jgi:hypothetical protein
MSVSATVITAFVSGALGALVATSKRAQLGARIVVGLAVLGLAAYGLMAVLK